MMKLSMSIMAAAYVPIVCTAPFPVIVVSFFFIGLGFTICLAIGNVFCANLRTFPPPPPFLFLSCVLSDTP